MRRRTATAAAVLAALLVAPTGANAAESASVSGGVLTYTSGAGTVDHVGLAPGSAAGRHLLSEPQSPSGTLGAGCVVVAAATAECSGVTTASLASLDGDDRILVTSAVPTTLDGGDGADTLTGGPAADTILGGDGADTIDARDGVTDTVDCGPGLDTVQADAVDILTACDEPKGPVEPTGDPVLPPGEPPVDLPKELPADVPQDLPKPPPGLPIGVLPPRIDTATQVTVTAPSEVKVGPDAVAAFFVGCASDQVAGCSGTVFLDPARRKGRPRALAARRGRFGRTRFSADAGEIARVRVTLTAAARSALGLPRGRKASMARRGRRVKATVTVVPRGGKRVRTSVTLTR